MQLLFATYGTFSKFSSLLGDTQVVFADYVNKVNPAGKVQKRGIVVTEKNIYKHDPKNYKVKKFGTPIVDVIGISLSKTRDTFVVLHCKGHYRDLVLDLGLAGNERYSEFVTIIVQERKKLTGEMLKVEFSEKIPYNNSRTATKPGQNCTLTFEASMDPKVVGSVFKTGKGNVNTVTYRNL